MYHLFGPPWSFSWAPFALFARPSWAPFGVIFGLTFTHYLPSSSLSWGPSRGALGIFLDRPLEFPWAPLGRPWDLRRASCRESSLLSPHS